jgi:hypothetical protein
VSAAPRSIAELMDALASGVLAEDADLADADPDVFAGEMVRAAEAVMGELSPTMILAMGERELVIAQALMRLAERRARAQEAADEINRWEDAS